MFVHTKFMEKMDCFVCNTCNAIYAICNRIEIEWFANWKLEYFSNDQFLNVRLGHPFTKNIEHTRTDTRAISLQSNGPESEITGNLKNYRNFMKKDTWKVITSSNLFPQNSNICLPKTLYMYKIEKRRS